MLSYATATGAAITLQNLGMVADGFAAQGTTGYRFTDPMRLLAAYAHAVALTQAEIRSATLDGLARWNVYPVDLSLNIPANPQVYDCRDFAPWLPTYEDVNFTVSDTQAAGESIIAHEWLGTPGWSSDLGLVTQMYGTG